MKNLSILLLVGIALLAASSCQTAKHGTGIRNIGNSHFTCARQNLGFQHRGVRRIISYDLAHPDIPPAFNGFRIAFISDLHYKSKFKEKGLKELIDVLNRQKAGLLLMGGDYQEGCEYVDSLFSALSRVRTEQGIYGVLGNNDYERCHDVIVGAMQRHGMHVLEQRVDTVHKNGQRILIAGIRNPFDLKRNGISPTLALSPDDFVILLVHTPDYAEDTPIDHSDIVLAGHTHGGQIRIFGLSPKGSRYGKRFLSGLASNSEQIPVITTNGIGTSRIPMRIGAPAEVVVITLRCPEAR